MAARLDVDREAVKTLVVAVGVREAARKMGLSEDTVSAWSARGHWLQANPLPTSMVRASNASKTPSAAMVEALTDDSNATKIGFARAARTVATDLAGKSATILTDKDTAQAANHWTGIASKVHGWEQKQAAAAAAVMVNVSILSA